MDLVIDFEQDQDGRWIAEIPDLPGVLVYGSSKEAASTRVKALALQVIADRLEQGELVAPPEQIRFRIA